MQTPTPVVKPISRFTLLRGILIVLLLLVGWIVIDLTIPRHSDMRQFNPSEVGRLDTGMWRSYYERRPLRLFSQLAELMRSQYRAPFWRSWVLAYQAGSAAFVFKDGKNRQEYANAQPYLERFYSGINTLAEKPFDVQRVSKMELEWWIIRREKDQFRPADWERILADEAAAVYHLPADRFREHAQLRVRAMMYRDHRNQDINESDWQYIRQLLDQSWLALHKAVNKTP